MFDGAENADNFAINTSQRETLDDALANARTPAAAHDHELFTVRSGVSASLSPGYSPVTGHVVTDAGGWCGCGPGCCSRKVAPEVVPTSSGEERTSLNTEAPAMPRLYQEGVTPVSMRLRNTSTMSEVQQVMHEQSPWNKVPGAERRHRVWLFVNEARSSMGALVFTVSIFILIIVSMLAFLFETMHQFDHWPQSVWTGTEYFCMSFFVVEMILRMYASTTFREYASDPLNALDVLIVVAFAVDVGVAAAGLSELRIVRVLRLVRVGRLFKLSRFSGTMFLLIHVIMNSISSLALLFVFIMMTVVIFSSGIYYVEGEERSDALYREAGFPNGNPFTSIPETVYWCVVTITAIGYGDTYPVTQGGQLLAILAVIVGSVVMAMPLSVVSTQFIKATRSVDSAMEQKMAEDAGTVTSSRTLARISSMRAPVSVVGTPKASDNHEAQMLRLIDESEARFDEKIDSLVKDLTALHAAMLRRGLLTERLFWR